MSSEAERPIDFSCPYCEGRKIETAATAPYVRGFLVAYQIGTKSFIGCVPCVRTKVLGEAGLSALIGWFSISALVVNPFLIVYNLIQTPFMGVNYAKARKKLSDLGIPENQDEVNVTHLAYALAASLMAADGNVDESEVISGIEQGRQLFPDFNDEEFINTVKQAKDMPAPQAVASMLREILSNDAKHALYNYLWNIAMADGHMDDSEKRVLTEIAECLAMEDVVPVQALA